MSNREYYKKIDKSFFKYGITIPKDLVSSFLCGEPIELSSSREITLKFNKEKYSCKLVHVDRTNASDVYQLRWDANYTLIKDLKTEYIQTYIAIESQNFIAKEEERYYITKLLGGNQEVAVFSPINSQLIELKTFIKIETPYDALFKKLIDRNVFGWLSKIENKSMTFKSTKWISIEKLPEHEDVTYVIYYLVDELNKEFYIGSAKRLGDRLKPGRKEIPNWNKFRYEIVHPEFHENLREIEYHSIMNFAHVFENEKRISNLALSDFKLVNKDYKYYLK